MISKKKVLDLIEEKLTEDLFVVEMSISTSNRILVVLDSEKGVSIDTCIAMSRQIEHNLDREEEDFELEVASFGIGEPLKLVRQYKKNIGRELEVVTGEGEKLVGLLIEVDDNAFTIQQEKKERVEGKKKRQVVVYNHTFSYDSVKTAKIVISFK